MCYDHVEGAEGGGGSGRIVVAVGLCSDDSYDDGVTLVEGVVQD